MLMQYNIYKMGFRIMKKILILVCLLFLQVQAAQNIHVKSLEEYANLFFKIDVKMPGCKAKTVATRCTLERAMEIARTIERKVIT